MKSESVMKIYPNKFFFFKLDYFRLWRSIFNKKKIRTW
jgi:hypothetical protein